MNSIRSLLYLFARLLGDANAVARGPKAIATRLARKFITRKLLGGIFK